VFETFLRRKVEENGNWQTLAWSRLLDRGVTAGLIDEWIAKISAAAPVFLNHLRDVRLWLGEGPHETRLLQSLASDLKAYEMVGKISEAIKVLRSIDVDLVEDVAEDSDNEMDEGPSSEEMTATFLEALRRLLEQKPPRLFETWDDVDDELRALDAPVALIQWVATQRLATMEDRRKTRDAEIAAEDQSALVGWTGPR